MTEAKITWSDLTHINHDKAWKVLRRTDREGLLIMMARALRIVRPNDLESIFKEYAHPHDVGDMQCPEIKPLLEAVREFRDAALRGEFYQEFRVNSQNCMDKSGKTEEFGARLDLLFDRCVAEADSTDPTEVCEAYETIFDLFREIDKFDKDIVFFADEGGVWQFHTNWKRVLPAYFRCLAKTTKREEFERHAGAVIKEFVDAWQRGELRQIATSLPA